MNALSVQESFMKSLFFGEIQENLVFPFPQLDPGVSETLRMTLDSIEKFAQTQVHSSEWDRQGKMPSEILQKLAELGLMGIAVPEQWGGLDLSQMGYVRIMQQMAGIDASLATTLGAHQSIGYKALLLFGTDEQKKRYLPRLASGELIACYCLTEPGSGSDAASIQTKAVLSEDEKYYHLTGNKLWITNAAVASFMTIFAKTPCQEVGKEKITCFLLELPAAGVTVGPSEDKLGLRGSWINAVHFENVRIPVENVVGGVGQGFKVAMGVLNHGRLGLAAGCVGSARVAVSGAVAHANERVQFQKKIGEFGMIQEKIGRMVTQLYVAESVLYLTASLIDRKTVDYSIESAIAKVFSSEMIWEVADETLQIWAGAGYMKEYPYERILRDARINRIFEGTNEILRSYIALAGMQAPGQELAGLAEAIRDPLRGLGLVTEFVFRKFKHSTIGQSILSRSMSKPHPALKKMAALLEECALEFATQVEVLLRRHGKSIVRCQFAQKRIADIAIDAYAMVATLSRVTLAIETHGESACSDELAIAEVFFTRANRRIHGNFKAISKNDDDVMKWIAGKAYEKGGYPFEVLKY